MESCQKRTERTLLDIVLFQNRVAHGGAANSTRTRWCVPRGCSCFCWLEHRRDHGGESQISGPLAHGHLSPAASNATMAEHTICTAMRIAAGMAVAVLAAALLTMATASPLVGSVHWKDGKMSFHPHVRSSRHTCSKIHQSALSMIEVPFCISLAQIDKNGSSAAWGSFADTLETAGWGELNMETSAAFSDKVQAFALGYLEASLSRRRIRQMWRAVHSLHNNAQVVVYLRAYDGALRAHLRRLRLYHGDFADLRQPHDGHGPHKRAATYEQLLPARDSIEGGNGIDTILYMQASLVVAQLDGLRAGYNAAADDETDEEGEERGEGTDFNRLSVFDAWMLQIDGDADAIGMHGYFCGSL
jgi:hypothetical protein